MLVDDFGGFGELLAVVWRRSKWLNVEMRCEGRR